MPSLAIACIIRGKLITAVKQDAVKPNIEQMYRMIVIHSQLTAEKASARAVSPLKFYSGAIPYRDMAINMYKIMQMKTESLIDAGKSLTGFFASSATDVTNSKPRYPKNTMDVPVSNPSTPFCSSRTKGVKLSALKYVNATIIIKNNEKILADVMTMLQILDSVDPRVTK
eukprot:CAMPEP_0116876418 /NCGR_PEP_ID=MMETSP0463-20121206/8362_1 /TAXON_ID=181622 /ORGANISM="Strombidinopsis sp, Strain SopsisLIS2011" /LENGTH=169 /DNA_ID=CAMNT_0004523007 /DNA_START=912 /DNA_END=1421 /DNA_ORIENTATION=+